LALPFVSVSVSKVVCTSDNCSRYPVGSQKMDHSDALIVSSTYIQIFLHRLMPHRRDSLNRAALFVPSALPVTLANPAIVVTIQFVPTNFISRMTELVCIRHKDISASIHDDTFRIPEQSAAYWCHRHKSRCSQVLRWCFTAQLVLIGVIILIVEPSTT